MEKHGEGLGSSVKLLVLEEESSTAVGCSPQVTS